MANPRSLVYALYTHWDTVEVLVRLSREFAVLTTEQVLGCIAKVAPQLDAEAQGTALRAMVNADILQPCARSSDLQLIGQHDFGQSYALTLAEWRQRFHARWQTISLLGFDDRFRRLWDYYLCYCEAGFAEGSINVGFYTIEHR